MWRELGFLLILLFRLSECKVRLVGGLSSSEGRVEILHNGKWGTVCDDRWDINDAKVVCRSLGQPDAIRATTLANFGDGSGEIWLDEVKCSGNEASLADCRHDGWGRHNCNHGEDAGVVCGQPDDVHVDVSSISGVITSPGYPQHLQRANYEWTFSPTIPNAKVLICLEDLDFRTYGLGSSRVTIEDSRNTEIFSLENSKGKGLCKIMERAGGKVTYYASVTVPRENRVIGFRIRYAAVDRSQAEDFCSNNWDISPIGKIGRVDLQWQPPPKQTKSGYTYLVVHKSSLSDFRANVTNSTSVVINNLAPSTEYLVRVIAVPLTNESNSAIFSCSKRVRTKNEQTRVTGGKTATEGYIQVYHERQWTRVCKDYSWNMDAANVACRSMGLVAEYIISYPRNRKISQQVLLSNSLNRLSLYGVRCSGREKSLIGCRYRKVRFCWGAAVACNKAPASKWRLFGGMFPNEGLLEVYHNGEWGRVCSERRWNIQAAKVACRSMGLPPPPFLLKPNEYRYWKPRGPGISAIPFTLRVQRKTWIKNPSCRGSERSLANCRYGRMRKHSCPYSRSYNNLVCGHPKVQRIHVNGTSGVITSPGYPWYAKQAHIEWIFKPVVPERARVLLWGFGLMDLTREDSVSKERSSLNIKDGSDTLFQLENKVGELTAVMATSDVKVSFYSSFTYQFGGLRRKRTGFLLRYLVIDKPCHENWNISVQANRPGRIHVTWNTIDDFSKSGRPFSKYTYVVMYNSTKDDIQTVKTVFPSVIIDYLPPNTLYSVAVYAYLADDTKSTDFYFCSVKDFYTHKGTIRLDSVITPNEGRILTYYQGVWGTIYDDKDFDLNDARVVCRSMGLPDPEYYRMKNLFGFGKVKTQYKALKCKGDERSLSDCERVKKNTARLWGDPDAAVVCGKPQEQHFNITALSGAIISPLYGKYMPMMHHVYHFPRPALSNAKMILFLGYIWLRRGAYGGEGILTIKDGTNTTLFHAKNKDGVDDGLRVLEVTSWPVTIEVYSSFTVSRRGLYGVNVPFIVVNESCRDWKIDATGKVGFITIGMKNLKTSYKQEFRYVTYYNSSSMATKKVKESKDYPFHNLYNLKVDTLYTVSAFGFPFNYTGEDKPFRYCTKNVRTSDVKLRLSGGKFPNEGRVEVFDFKYWSMICGTEWDLNDAKVACRSLGLPEATRAFNQSDIGKANRMGVRLNRLQCAGNETSLSKCPQSGWKWVKKGSCPSVAGVVCGQPQGF